MQAHVGHATGAALLRKAACVVLDDTSPAGEVSSFSIASQVLKTFVLSSSSLAISALYFSLAFLIVSAYRICWNPPLAPAAVSPAAPQAVHTHPTVTAFLRKFGSY